MNLSPEQMQFLADKGLSLAEVIEFAGIESARSSGAARQARYRAKQKAERSDVTRDVTAERNDPSLSLPPNENNSNPPAHTHPEISPRARKGHRLPEDWEPKPLPADLATAVAAWPAGAMERELARFRDWAASASGPVAVKNNWDAAWRNWLRKAEDEGRYGRQNGGTIRQGNGAGADKRSGFARAIDRELERVSALP